MKKCSDCSGELKEHTTKTPEGVSYTYFKCVKCGDEILNMSQLQAVAQKYRIMKQYHTKVARWGMSLGVRIPKELAEKYHLSDNEEITLVPDKEGIKLIPV